MARYGRVQKLGKKKRRKSVEKREKGENLNVEGIVCKGQGKGEGEGIGTSVGQVQGKVQYRSIGSDSEGV